MFFNNKASCNNKAQLTSLIAFLSVIKDVNMASLNLTYSEIIIMTIKKTYIEVIAFLEANQSKKVSSILEELKVMCSARNGGGSDVGTTYHKNAEGETVAVFCYYFKRWMPTNEVEFGAKVNTASGLNTMCKVGVSLWTKQQRIAKNEELELLTKVGKLEIEPTSIEQVKAEIEARRVMIDYTLCPTPNFETFEQLQAHLAL